MLEAASPFLAIIGGLLGLYIIYKIIHAISSQLLRKRIKRIDNNVSELDKKITEILAIVKNPRSKVKSKTGS